MESPSKNAKNKPGRPAGSKIVEKPVVQSVPPACPTCHSTDCVQIPGCGPMEKEIKGTLPSTGQRYTSIIWRSKLCQRCGQRFKVRCYLFDPEKW